MTHCLVMNRAGPLVAARRASGREWHPFAQTADFVRGSSPGTAPALSPFCVICALIVAIPAVTHSGANRRQCVSRNATRYGTASCT